MDDKESNTNKENEQKKEKPGSAFKKLRSGSKLLLQEHSVDFVDVPDEPFELDTVLVNEIGQIGRYQIGALLKAAFPVILIAFTSGEYIFTMAKLPTRCYIHECEYTPSPPFWPSWILNAIPGESQKDFDQCNRYVGKGKSTPVNGTCPADLFDQGALEKCTSYVFEYTNSIVYDFGLECNEFLRTFAGSLRNLGSLFVQPFTGFVSDRRGRRFAFLLNILNASVIGIIRSFSVNFPMFLALEMLEVTLGGGSYQSIYILVTELFGPKYRVVAGTVLFTSVALGSTLLGPLSALVRPWRWLTRVIYIPLFCTVGYYWVLHESVRWLMTKHRFTEVEEILKTVARINKKEISDNTIKAFRLHADTETAKEIVKEKNIFRLVLQHRPVAIRCCVTPIWWMTTTLVWYGLSLNSVLMAGNRYLNYSLVSVIEIPGYWTSLYVLNRFGRKKTLICGFYFCSLSQFLFAFLPKAWFYPKLIIYLLGKYAISCVMTSIYVYTAELYPTKYRHSLFAFSSMIGRIGSISAPFTPFLMTIWTSLPSVIFGCFAFLAGSLTLLVPETLGQKLPDTFSEADLLSTRRQT